MAGLKGKSGHPGNMNAIKHGLAAIQKRREEGITTEHEESVRKRSQRPSSINPPEFEVVGPLFAR